MNHAAGAVGILIFLLLTVAGYVLWGQGGAAALGALGAILGFFVAVFLDEILPGKYGDYVDAVLGAALVLTMGWMIVDFAITNWGVR
ncbi:hypothetical protein EDC40_101233 [Aminobacter aminovorans]|uniref:Uncharacterized protein n=1 Tax=Aminobacter aminovorans TaxID=83263 RepID=A0A380WP86_AMIAI|nr:hypothetical protein [Aminobacter aminovorans]TCS29918.1 hypothetical protein EDC40_101233 [Aminobacter aminovorans]SUU90767.1 Uncharacterised protein [Aminobacter aminovorans]